MKRLKTNLLLLVATLLELPAAVARRIKYRGQRTCIGVNAFTPAIHQKQITKFTSSAIAARWSLLKIDTANTTNGVAVCTTGDRALFVAYDNPQSADITLENPAEVSCIMLDATDESVPMVAAGAIAVGSIVYPVANGQVNTYVGLGSTGTNYPCGIVIANASAQAGDILEVMPLLSVNSSTN